ncbi:hypothetical protein SAMN04488029_3311 [Reichenbachiella faecimaris]|uniref:Uncharacterized protein n=1 Tax=Reichenbachiella faecimaris TaxID=692418 RepID=A0A1W2GLK6_REIFA|nr:hypothetical protein [Reichenbachiella faecimaris]SMD37238.1 hypothetical protein SAMN04488029_3311 [Reichenbachiella faecimaris]
MKKLIFTLCALFMTCAMSQAQSKNDLKGPKAKNYKVWQDDSQSVTVYTEANQASLKGPEAKNQKVWADSTADTNKVTIKRDTRKNSLKGPAAKNFKPWK